MRQAFEAFDVCAGETDPVCSRLPAGGKGLLEHRSRDDTAFACVLSAACEVQKVVPEFRYS